MPQFTHPVRRLDSHTLLRGVAELSRNDPGLGSVISRHGPPPLWSRRAGIATLIRIVLEQQVSLASGRAIYLRTKRALGDVTCDTITRRGERGLTRLGITRQKAAYCVAVAREIEAGRLDLSRIGRAPVPQARQELLLVKGIGPWTADVYLMMAVRRPDVWPPGDVALLTALQHLRGWRRRPTVDEAAEEARAWRPWRSVAARILWHGYLAGSLAGRGNRRQR